MIVKLFYTMLEISLSVSAVVVLILLLMPVLKKRFAAKWRYWVWLILAIRLLIPLNYHLPQPAVQIQTPQKTVLLRTSAPTSTSEETASLRVPQTRKKPAAGQLNWLELAAAVWSAGAVLLLAYRFSAYFFFLREIRRWSAPVTDGETLAVLQTEKSELGVHQNIMIRRSKKISGPMTTGFFQPMLLLPEDSYGPDDLRLILKHELIHLKHRDVWFKFLLSLAGAVHWFNPFIWLMVRRAGEDTELVCDGDVVAGESDTYRKYYGEVILAAVRQSRYCRVAYTTYFCGGVKMMKHRLSNIMDSGKKHKGIVAFCIAVLIIAGVGGSVAFGAAGGQKASPASVDTGSSEAKTVSSAGISSNADVASANTKIISSVSSNVESGLAQGHSTVSSVAPASPSSQSSVPKSENNWTVDADGGQYQVNGDWIIYDSNRDTYKLHKKKKDGSGDVILVNQPVMTPCMADGWIYYFNTLDEIDKIKADGTQRQKVCSTNGFENLDGSTAVYAVSRGDYILYKLVQFVPAGDNKTAKPSVTTYYKFDLPKSTITRIKDANEIAKAISGR